MPHPAPRSFVSLSRQVDVKRAQWVQTERTSCPCGRHGRAPGVRHEGEVKNVRALSYRTELVIRRAPEDVFDYCSDLRSELQ
jgi:hypothetical protein